MVHDPVVKLEERQMGLCDDEVLVVAVIGDEGAPVTRALEVVRQRLQGRAAESGDGDVMPMRNFGSS